jgi:hypothetical protein
VLAGPLDEVVVRVAPARIADRGVQDQVRVGSSTTRPFVSRHRLPARRVEAIKSYLDEAAPARGIRYGIHVSQTALMTCLVMSAADSLHVHFVDGEQAATPARP